MNLLAQAGESLASRARWEVIVDAALSVSAALAAVFGALWLATRLPGIRWLWGKAKDAHHAYRMRPALAVASSLRVLHEENAQRLKAIDERLHTVEQQNAITIERERNHDQWLADFERKFLTARADESVRMSERWDALLGILARRGEVRSSDPGVLADAPHGDPVILPKDRRTT